MKITVRHVLDLILSKNFIGVEMTIALVRVSNLNIQLKLTKSIAIVNCEYHVPGCGECSYFEGGGSNKVVTC